MIAKERGAGCSAPHATMAGSSQPYDVLILGAGLSGLATAYYLKKTKPEWSILVVERSGTAGGLTGNWIDHRFGPDKKLQMPMHMVFRQKYKNLLKLVDEEIGGSLSPLYKGYTIITGDGQRHRLAMEDWTARRLPPPFHALGMFAKLKMPLREKWDLFKLACVSTYCAKEILEGKQEPRRVPNTLSLESLELILNMGAKSRDFLEAVTPSIYNLHPWYTSAPRMAGVMAGTMTLSQDSLHYHVFAKNYNAAFIDRFVARLQEMGVEFRFWTEARRLEADADGRRVERVWVRPYGPEHPQARRYVCVNCGAENYFLDRAFCTRCGRDTTLDRVRSGEIAKPVARELWLDAEAGGCVPLECRRLVTAMYPHMIARLLPAGSPLRRHPYVRSFFSARGNQTQLSVGRVYYRKPVTRGDGEITGTHNPYLCFNGCQSVYNNFGGADLGYEGDVVDVLLDVGVIRDAHTQEEQIQRILFDLQRVYPDADPALAEHVSFADIYPDVLYLSEQPAVAGLHRFFDTHRTGAENWYVAGCHSGTIGIGMESAVQSGMATVNCLLEDARLPDRIPIQSYEIHWGSRMTAGLGNAIVWWKGRGRSLGRLAGSTYSMPPK
ncbi:FAD-dependent oxidoreductase [Deltaproteobacteria bacterium PRO3]|nr:FAD-dependent oxidoreductase [Deltaproteobacteria bacterium PRO3]